MHEFDIPKEVYERARVAAEAQGVSVERFMLDAIYEAIEDFEDVRAAEAALKRIADGEDELYTLGDLEKLFEMDDNSVGAGKETICKAS